MNDSSKLLGRPVTRPAPLFTSQHGVGLFYALNSFYPPNSQGDDRFVGLVFTMLC
jgi:hypothetical protein